MKVGGGTLSLTPFFARSLTLVPRSLPLNRTEMLARQDRVNQASLFGHDGRLLYSSGRGYIFAVWVKCVVVLFARQLAPRKCRLSKVDDYRNSSTIK